MTKILDNKFKHRSGISKKSTGPLLYNTLRLLAFDNSLQANIITTAGSGKIILANNAAAKLLGYSKKMLMTKSRADIFDSTESNFKKMLKQRTAVGSSAAVATAIKKNGKPFPCEITSAVFIDEAGIENAITTIVDLTPSIQKQKGIDAKNEKRVSDNLDHIRARQKDLDSNQEKIVAKNIAKALVKSDARLAENNEWIKYIAKTSYDVMWDWDISTGEIYVGDSIEEVFGYQLHNNTANFTDFTCCLLPEEQDEVVKKLMNTLASGKKSWSDSFMFKRKDGSVAAATSRASIVRNEDGKAIRLIGAIQDISRLQDLEKELQMQISLQEKHKFFLAAKLSFDVIWDWNLLTNEVFLGEGFEELFGYPVKNNKGNIGDWGKYLHPDDKEAFETGLHEVITSNATHWEHSYRFIRADGTIAKIFDRANIIRHPGGKAYRMIGAMQDISRQKELEEKLDLEIVTKGKLLTEFKESFKLIFNSSSDVLFDCNLITNELMISDAYEKEYGYKITASMNPIEHWASHIHPDDKETVMQDYLRALGSEDIQWKYNYRYIRADNSVANLTSSSIILRNEEGKAYRIIGSLQDNSKQKVLEERLEQEIKLKEIQIAQAMEDAKGTERSDIGKELHDNISQLLGVSKMYLDMARQGGEKGKMHLKRSSEYTLTAIEEIRKLTKGLTTDVIRNLGLNQAIDNIVRETMEVNPVKVSSNMESFIESSVDDKFKLNVYRIVQEQLNNILKHAKATEVTISLVQNKNTIVLSISDNGVGFDTRKKRKGIGVDNIRGRARAYHGIAEFVSQPGQGCVLTATFPIAVSATTPQVNTN